MLFLFVVACVIANALGFVVYIFLCSSVEYSFHLPARSEFLHLIVKANIVFVLLMLEASAASKQMHVSSSVPLGIHLVDLSFSFSAVDQSMFENSIAQQQSPQTSRPGQHSTRRSPASANHNLGSSSVDSLSFGGQQRLKNAINLGKAVGAKVSAVLFFCSRYVGCHVHFTSSALHQCCRFMSFFLLFFKSGQ